jgi:hypothetical protein
MSTLIDLSPIALLRMLRILTFILQSVHLLYKYAIRFRPVSQRVQMNFIFSDNVRILCLSCNVKKVGKLVRFKQKGQKQAPVSKARTNKIYIYRQCRYIVYISIIELVLVRNIAQILRTELSTCQI